MGLTELYCVQRGDVAAERLHREDGDLVADISGGRPAPWSAWWNDRLYSRSLVGKCAILTQRQPSHLVSTQLYLSLCVRMMGGQMLGLEVVCSWMKEGASPYMTGNSEDAGLWDWQIGWHPLYDLANAPHGKSKGGRVAAGWRQVGTRDAVRMSRGQ